MKSLCLKFLPFLMLLGVMTFVTSCGDDDEDPIPETPKSIVEIAQDDAQFSSLVAALTKAELVSTINSGTYTVFAPTNAAFDQLFMDLGVDGLDDLSKEALTPILLYHVVGGTVKSTDLANTYVNTASTGPNDQPIKMLVDITDGVKLNKDVSVTSADIEATNGVVHVIDKVLLPPNTVTLALNDDRLSILVAALTRSDLNFDFVSFLAAANPSTVFAPTNDAFVALLGTNPDWNTLEDIDATTLEAVLKYHVISGINAESTSLVNNTMVPTANGAEVTINTTTGVQIVDVNSNAATVVIADVQGTNGVVHVIDQVLDPR